MPKLSQDVLMKQSAKMAIDMTAKMFGMKPETVAKILQVGIPMQMKLISENPEVAKQMYAASFKMMPEEVQNFYKKLAQDAKAAGVTKEQYQAMFGASIGAINEAAAEAAGVTPEQAADVMAATAPAVQEGVKEEAEAAGVKDAAGFAKWAGKQA